MIANRQQIAGAARRAQVWLVLALLVTLATGCAEPAGPQPVVDGSFSPEAAVESFFAQLGEALRDPQLGTDAARSYWVERLASYFVPAERPAQRAVLRDALATFAAGLAELEPGEEVTLELRGFDQVEAELLDGGRRALVRVPAGTLVMLVTRDSAVVYEQTIGLGEVIGRPDQAVPTIQIDGRWYLTEG